MTLAMTLGMTIGVRRTMWMMWGELFGVAIVSVAAVLGVAAMMFHTPALFTVLKYIGGAYLLYLGVQLWRCKGKMAVTFNPLPKTSKLELGLQGLLTAVANPKGWAFTISFLPPFIDPQRSLFMQLLVLLSIILIVEFICLVGYAAGGRSLRIFLERKGNVTVLNRIAGTLMCGVAFWLILG